mmetsp:Transcript_8296/g.23125  ORF Transcript_8296/g.23125 Transcript_8296/m.23125 type:complete len:253 (+) Transcript_8296:233-991(+)
MPQAPPPQAPPPRNHEGEIVRVQHPPSSSRDRGRGRSSRYANANSANQLQHHRQPASTPASSSPSREHTCTSDGSFPSNDAVAGDDDHDHRSVMSAASSVSALTMGTARHPPAAAINTCAAGADSRAKAAAVVIGGDDVYSGGSAVGINIAIPGDANANAATTAAAATSNSNANRSHIGRRRARPLGGAARVVLPILPEDSDSDDDNDDENNNDNEHNNEHLSESTNRPRSGRHLRVHASGSGGGGGGGRRC